MSNSRDIALKLERYFESHLESHPEWAEALALVQDWRAAMGGAGHDPLVIGERASLLEVDGSAIVELQIMIRAWIAGADSSC